MKVSLDQDGMVVVEADGHDGTVTLVMRDSGIVHFAERGGRIYQNSMHLETFQVVTEWKECN